jgi:indole-3-glycerol phosphate synthase
MKAEMQEKRVLTGILASTAIRVAAQATDMTPVFKAAAGNTPHPPSFSAALIRHDVAIIGEVKRRSPSAGAIRENTPASMLAEDYAVGGAAAISVLTEEEHFGGSLDDLFMVTGAVTLPALCKDFIIDPLQVYEARAAGAAAILLIVRALTEPKLRDLAMLARDIGMDTLVEIHSEAELEIAVSTGTPVIGVNSRDLETLVMDPSLHERLIPKVPPGIIAVAESGLKTRADVERVAAFGADACLIGTSVASADMPHVAMAGLVGVKRARRGD